MTPTFINRIGFRIGTALFVGVFGYLVILMYYNNLEQIKGEFFSQELMVCVIISLVNLEISRWLLDRFSQKVNDLVSWIPMISFLCLGLASLCTASMLFLYYNWIIGYPPAWSEYVLFLGVFGVAEVLLILLYVSQIYLSIANGLKLAREKEKKQELESAYLHFKESIHPALFIQGMESMILELQKDKSNIDPLVNSISTIYRYLLGHSDTRIVPISKELEQLPILAIALQYPPAHAIKIIQNIRFEFSTLTGTAISIIELISRTILQTLQKPMTVEITEKDDYWQFIYPEFEKLTQPMSLDRLRPLNDKYLIYSDLPIKLEKSDGKITISIPKLFIT